MKLHKLIVPILLIALLTTWQACKKDSSENEDNFDRTALLSSMSDEVILPLHSSFVPRTVELTSATEAFVNSPSQSNLNSLQDAWQTTKLSWKPLAMYDFGPAMDQLVHNRVDKWPTNTAFIENFITTEDTITSAFINTIGSTSVGLPAMEYLIFSPDGDAAIIDSFTTSARVAKRKQYLLSLSQSLELAASVLLDIWAESGDNYITEFKNNTQNGLQGSVNILANQMVAVAERLLRQNIANALEANDPEQVEAPYAHTSLELLREGVVGLRNSFNGGTTASDIGFDDYLNELNAQYNGAPLSETINNQIDLVLTKVDAVPGPLSDAVVNSTTKVQAVYDALRDLLVLIKVDMASSLSVTITFSDNDGD